MAAFGIKSATKKGTEVTVVFDLSKTTDHHPSSTGNSTILASTGGTWDLGEGLKLTASVFAPLPKDKRPVKTS